MNDFLRGLDRWLTREEDDRDDYLIATCDECRDPFPVATDDDDTRLCSRCRERAKVTPQEVWERR